MKGSVDLVKENLQMEVEFFNRNTGEYVPLEMMHRIVA